LWRAISRFIPAINSDRRGIPGAGADGSNNIVASRQGRHYHALIARACRSAVAGGQGVRFEPLALNWIGSTSQEVSVIAVRSDTGVKTLDDVKTREVVVAGPAPGTDGVTFPTALNNLIGTKFKIVTGYRSGAEMTLAVERKEVDGRGSWSWASFRNDGMAMLKRGELTLLVQMATAKSPDIPQVPLVMDYAKSDEQRQVLELLLAGQAMAWPVFAPAEVRKIVWRCARPTRHAA
jgi:tripartite-type tricarboxylate transporter receptor subunit TctC